jgi:hypothetical protein
MTQQAYFIPEGEGAKAAFDTEWAAVEARLKKILPLKDANGAVVDKGTKVLSIDFSKAADALYDAPDNAGLVARFFEVVTRKDSNMTVEQLLSRPSGEVTRWRRMGNRISLLQNALVLHMNSK